MLAAGDVVIDLGAHTVRRRGAVVRLTRREFDLLAILFRHAGKVMTHQQLLREMWGPASEDEKQYLRVYVGQLRAKLEDDPAAPKLILTEPGIGYRVA